MTIAGQGLRRMAVIAACAAGLGWALPAVAQSPFSAVITVNDSAVTGWEIDQRTRLLDLFGTPGDLPQLAREQLVEDRLKEQELARVGMRLTDEGLARAMEEFAGQGNLTLDQLLGLLAENGIAEETLRDYVATGVTWRDYIRDRYGRRVQISENDIDLAIAQAAAGDAGVEVLLSEIIIPAPPERAEAARATAERIAAVTSTAVFESAAREVSALPSREQGGRLPWTPLANFPAPLRPLILGLAPGQVTAPIDIPNGIALFQMRDIRQTPAAPAAVASIDHAVFHVPDAAAAQAVIDRADTCDDLFGIAFDLPPEVLERADLPPDAIARDVALALATLDPFEAAVIPGPSGARVVMLCARTPAGELPDRAAVATRLRSERLAGHAAALVEELRAAATITGQ